MDPKLSVSDSEKISCSLRQEYSALINEDASEIHPPLRRTRRREISLSQANAGCLSLAIFLLLILCIYLLVLLRNLPLEVERHTNDHGYKGPIAIQYDATLGPYIECEKTTYPARPTDCSFDLLANGWVPSPCFDAQMHHDAVDGRDFAFYLDYPGKQKLHQEVIMQGNISMFPQGLWHSWREHVEHCWYLVNGSVRATVAGLVGRLDTWVDDGHMQHCFHLMTHEKKHDAGYVDYYFKALFGHHRCYLGHGYVWQRVNLGG
ncbi:hypothetical protein BJX64DRAFT_293910 [Aspergillus heterothallicus]